MITKNDILGRKFNKTLRGYDPVEVKYFLEMLAEEFEKLEERITELEPIEKQLSDLKVKSPDDLIAEAEKKGRKIIEDAEKLAVEVIEQTKKQKTREYEEVVALKSKKDRLLKSLNDVIHKHKELISILSGVAEESEANKQEEEIT